MEEYIEKRYLVEEFIERAEAWETAAKIDNNLEYKGMARAYRNTCTIIKKMPSADVRENIHGHWLDTSNGWMCSICDRDSKSDTNFCPNCGADMRCEIK